MAITLKLLRPVTDGEGPHVVGSYYTCDDKEARRLLGLKAGKVVSKVASLVDSIPEVKAEDVEIPDSDVVSNDEEGEYMSEEEYQNILIELSRIDGLNNALAEKLVEIGLQSIQDIANSSLKELTAIDGIGAKSGKKIIASAKGLLKDEGE